MDSQNSTIRKHTGSALTSKGLSILLVFSFMVTVLAFGVAYSEHRKMTLLTEKYDEAIIKINNCEEVLTALVKQMETTTSDDEDAVVITEEDAPTEIPDVSEEPDTTLTEEYNFVPENEPITSKPAPTEKDTEKATSTTKAPNASGPYFVTQSGKKYHVGSCSYLSKSKIPISADRIKAEGYSPCSRCIK